jgi:hypothetical protein
LAISPELVEVAGRLMLGEGETQVQPGGCVMAFEVHDYLDLVRLLGEHPEWRAELRRLLLTDELLALPEMVRELIEAQQRIEAQIAVLAEAQQRTEAQVAALAEAQRRTEQELAALAEAQVAALVEAQRRSEERLERLESAVYMLTQQVQELVNAQRRTDNTVGSLKGYILEDRYRKKASAYFGCLLRRPQVVEPDTLWDDLEARLSEEEVTDVLLVDLIVRGQPRAQPEAPEVWLAVEVSAVVDENDVERARRRAELLRRAATRRFRWWRANEPRWMLKTKPANITWRCCGMGGCSSGMKPCGRGRLRRARAEPREIENQRSGRMGVWVCGRREVRRSHTPMRPYAHTRRSERLHLKSGVWFSEPTAFIISSWPNRKN